MLLWSYMVVLVQCCFWHGCVNTKLWTYMLCCYGCTSVSANFVDKGVLNANMLFNGDDNVCIFLTYDVSTLRLPSFKLAKSPNIGSTSCSNVIFTSPQPYWNDPYPPPPTVDPSTSCEAPPTSRVPRSPPRTPSPCTIYSHHYPRICCLRHTLTHCSHHYLAGWLDFHELFSLLQLYPNDLQPLHLIALPPGNHHPTHHYVHRLMCTHDLYYTSL